MLFPSLQSLWPLFLHLSPLSSNRARVPCKREEASTVLGLEESMTGLLQMGGPFYGLNIICTLEQESLLDWFCVNWLVHAIYCIHLSYTVKQPFNHQASLCSVFSQHTFEVQLMIGEKMQAQIHISTVWHQWSPLLVPSDLWLLQVLRVKVGGWQVLSFTAQKQISAKIPTQMPQNKQLSPHDIWNI